MAHSRTRTANELPSSSVAVASSWIRDDHEQGRDHGTAAAVNARPPAPAAAASDVARLRHCVVASRPAASSSLFFSCGERKRKEVGKPSLRGGRADAQSALTVGGSAASQTRRLRPIARLGWPSQAIKRGCRSAERRASMVRALDRYSSGKDVAYRFAALGPAWLLSLV